MELYKTMFLVLMLVWKARTGQREKEFVSEDISKQAHKLCTHQHGPKAFKSYKVIKVKAFWRILSAKEWGGMAFTWDLPIVKLYTKYAM